ncbi:MAG: tRNA (adenine-N1)-methyltransferase [Actinomycetota bacterium]
MTPGKPFEPGERALLIDSKERRYLVTLESGKQFHSHMGILEHDALIGELEGVRVQASKGGRLLAVRPTLSDFVLKMKRGAQVVYPKDVGLILVYADVYPGASVLEAGTGSASLTLALARAVGETGRVVSYELRQDHHDQARANVDTWFDGIGGVPQNLDLRVGDVFEDVAGETFDRMVLDMPEPWRAIGTTTIALTAGGIICCYLPTIPQVQQTVDALRSSGFGMIETLEGLVRTWKVEGQSVRPDHRMVAHTGFLVIARKLSD